MAEKEYIEREAVIDELDELKELYRDSGAACDVIVLAKRAIRKIPAADVRPVVTCADCKHWTRIKKDCILASCDLDALVRCEDFYCANGEKREES